MDYDMIEKLNIDELKNYLKIRGLKVGGRKKELVARVFAAQENDVKPVKTAVEVEDLLKKDNSVLIHDRNIKLLANEMYKVHNEIFPNVLGEFLTRLQSMI